MCLKTSLSTYSRDSYQMPHSVASDLSLHCLIRSLCISCSKAIFSHSSYVSVNVFFFVFFFLTLSFQNESEILPFPNKECDFNLPGTSDFTDLQNKAFPRLIGPKPPEDSKQEHRSDKHDSGELLTLKVPITTAVDDNFFYFIFCIFFFSEKTSLDSSCESSAWQDLFSL